MKKTTFQPKGKVLPWGRISMDRLLLIMFAAFALIQTALYAQASKFEAKHVRSRTNPDGPDFFIHETAGPGWFSNLGPTGIRAMLRNAAGKSEYETEGTQYEVKFIFPNSPASGKVQVGDMIVGANGQRFQTSYKFGYWFGFGPFGPLTEFGRAVEEAESTKNGVLDILLVRAGAEMTVSVELPMKEGFAPTWPYNCPKSQKLKNEAIQGLLKLQESDGTWPGHGHGGAHACLALLAQGKTYQAQVEKYLDRIQDKGFGDGTWNWPLALNGICMAEYKIANDGSTRYDKTLIHINELFKKNQRYANGTFGHEGNAGKDGYGPMSGVTGLVCVAWAMIRKAGIPIHEDAYRRTLITVDMTFPNKGGDHGYGWPDVGKLVWEHNPSLIVSALDNLDADINEYYLGSRDRSMGLHRGAIALYNLLAPWQDYSPKVARHYLNKLTRVRRGFFTGHGSGAMHAMWSILPLGYAANTGNSEPLRLTLDENRDLLNASRVFDGSFYINPQRDGTDHARGSRTLPTGVWAMVLSVSDKNLVVLGKQSGLSIKDQAAKTNDFRIHVRFSKNTLFIKLNGHNPQRMAIYDVAGNLVKNLSMENGEAQWNWGGREKGLYFIQVLVENKILTKKIILQ